MPDANGRRPNLDSKFESHPDRVAEAIAKGAMHVAPFAIADLKIMQASVRQRTVDQMGYEMFLDGQAVRAATFISPNLDDTRIVSNSPLLSAASNSPAPHSSTSEAFDTVASCRLVACVKIVRPASCYAEWTNHLVIEIELPP